MPQAALSTLVRSGGVVVIYVQNDAKKTENCTGRTLKHHERTRTVIPNQDLGRKPSPRAEGFCHPENLSMAKTNAASPWASLI